MNKDIKLQHMCVDDIAPLNVGSPKINRPYAKLMGTLAIVITQGFLLGGEDTVHRNSFHTFGDLSPPDINSPLESVPSPPLSEKFRSSRVLILCFNLSESTKW